MAELTDEPLSYQLHIVPNQDGQNNHGEPLYVAHGLSVCLVSHEVIDRVAHMLQWR